MGGVTVAHTAGGLAASLIYIAVPLLLVGLLLLTESKKWGILLIVVAVALGAFSAYRIWHARAHPDANALRIEIMTNDGRGSSRPNVQQSVEVTAR